MNAASPPEGLCARIMMISRLCKNDVKVIILLYMAERMSGDAIRSKRLDRIAHMRVQKGGKGRGSFHVVLIQLVCHQKE